MHVSRNWLAEFLPAAREMEGLAALLTDIGIEVEGVDAGLPAAALAKIKVGHVRKARPIPKTKLFACLVDAGLEHDVEVVCGAPNVRRGLRAPLALPGVTVGDTVIAKREIQGVASAGMLCSAAELGLGDDAERLLELGKRDKPGASLARLVESDDVTYDLSITPNRGDWLSMLGVAREIAAKTGARLARPRAPTLKTTEQPYHAAIDADAASLCPKFTCLPLSGIDASAPTPGLIRQRLLRCGVRPVSVIVDITNYVMLELGQPLHAFDRDRLSGDITVRLAKKGEPLELLDGTKAKLSDNTLVVADSEGAQAIGGVMGGLASGVTDATANILLEAAHFVPSIVRGRTRELNISSEAAFRFERGVDPTMCEIAIQRAAKLIMRHCGGKAGPLSVAGATPAAREAIELRKGKVEKLTGVSVGQALAKKRLKALGFTVSAKAGNLHAAPPQWRFDAEIPEDLVEEVIRLGGYAGLPTTMPTLRGEFAQVEENLLDAKSARDRLVADGFSEIITYAFVSPQWERDYYGSESPITLTNPLAAELGAMRSGLLGGLIDRAVYNAHRRQTSLRLFELGRCFSADDDSQPQMLAALAWGPAADGHWSDDSHMLGFFDLAGTLRRLLPGADLSFKAIADHPALHPGRAASVSLGERLVGLIGEIHPRLLDKQRCDLQPAPVVFELNFDKIETLPRNRRAKPFARFPLVRRDLALVADLSLPVERLVKSAKEDDASGHIVDVQVFDRFAGKGVPQGKCSVGLRIIMQGTDSNLVDEQINSVMDDTIRNLEGKFNVQARS